jgi:hypothetical protein
LVDGILSYLGSFLKKKDSLKFIIMLVIKPLLSLFELFFDPVAFFFLLFALWSDYGFYTPFMVLFLLFFFKNFFGIFPENIIIGKKSKIFEMLEIKLYLDKKNKKILIFKI